MVAHNENIRVSLLRGGTQFIAWPRKSDRKAEQQRKSRGKVLPCDKKKIRIAFEVNNTRIRAHSHTETEMKRSIEI